MSDTVSVERVIPAPPEKIFDLLADPTRHKDIDGSGSLVEAKRPAGRLTLGDTFGMAMKMGVPYTMVSTIIELEENRRIAWQTRSRGGRTGGRIWRYELEPVGTGTRVRETWDITQESAFTKPLVKMGAKKTASSMEKTLARIEELLT